MDPWGRPCGGLMSPGCPRDPKVGPQSLGLTSKVIQIQCNKMYVCIIPPFAAILISYEKVFEVKGSFEKDISLEMSSY